MKKPIKLCDIHRYLRYYLKYNDISNILTEVAFEIYISCMDNKYVSMLELSKKRCIIMDKYTNIISILSKNLIKLNDKKYENNIDLIGLNKKLSFLNNFSDKIGLSSISGKNLDILSFRILDFIFMCGKERKNGYDKLFGKWFTRNPQMLFKQKGELYILNFLYNFIKCITKELFNGNPIKNPKIFIKNYTDNYLYRDISPYYSSFKSLKIQNLEIENIKTKLEKIGYRCKKATEVSCNFNKIFSVKEISERKLGFELEHQVKYTGSYDYKKMSESDRNKWIKENLYSNAIKYPLLAKAESGLCGDHIDHDACNGKITRDWSNIQLIKKDSVYFPCEYSSPVANNYKDLEININEICNALKENYAIVRQDAGVHIHVSIEDLLENSTDSNEIKLEKFKAIKRIFINFILLEDQINKVLPEYRRDGNSFYSSNSYKSFFNNNIDLTLGLINSCKSYDEIKEVLSITWKYLSLMPFGKTLEFRTLNATIEPKVISKWAELLVKFVQNSINNQLLEKCLDKKLLEELLLLTQNGTKIEGVRDDDIENLCYPVNTWDTNNFKCVPSVSVSKMLSCNNIKISAQEVQNNCFEYTQSVTKNFINIGGKYLLDPFKMPNELKTSLIAFGISRKPGEFGIKKNQLKIRENGDNLMDAFKNKIYFGLYNISQILNSNIFRKSLFYIKFNYLKFLKFFNKYKFNG